MNYSEIISRLTSLEQKVEKLTPNINVDTPTFGANIVGVDGALGIQLIGITTTQRTALGVHLATLDGVKHILVYDTEDETFYTWSGTEWV